MSFTVIVPDRGAARLRDDARPARAPLGAPREGGARLRAGRDGDPRRSRGPRIARLAEHRGEVVILNFWASWCLACRSEHASLSRIAARYEGQGVHFYGASTTIRRGTRSATSAPWAGRRTRRCSTPGAASPSTTASGVPETFFIGPDGSRGHKQIGPVNDAILVEWIERLRTPPWKRNETASVRTRSLSIVLLGLAVTAGAAQVKEEASPRRADARARRQAALPGLPGCLHPGLAHGAGVEMKNVIRQQLVDGQTPDEVKAYFVARYGEWVLLEPERRASTWSSTCSPLRPAGRGRDGGGAGAALDAGAALRGGPGGDRGRRRPEET
jgi:hypothetical protein